MGFSKLMSSTARRIIRIVAGIVLIVVGLFLLSTNQILAIILAVVGLIPLLAGILDVCLFGPIFGGPLRGKDARGGE